jgi:hypothetical protein
MDIRRRVRRLRRRWKRQWRDSRFAFLTRRRVLIGLGIVGGLAVLWIAVTGYLAARQAAQLQGRLQQVKLLVAQGRVDDARRLAKDIPAMAERAHRLTTGPAWWVAAHVPLLGEPLEETRGAVAAADRVGSVAVPELIGLAQSINPGALRVSGTTIRTAPLVAARAKLAKVARLLDEEDEAVDDLPSSWLPIVNNRRNQLSDQLSSIRGYVDAAARAAQVLPRMLGDSGPKRYFVGLQNEAELRGTGGLPGAFTIAVANHGTLRFTRFLSDSAMLPVKTGRRIETHLDFGGDYNSAYGGSDPTSSYLDSNVSPDFPYTARIWAAMWQKVSGQRVDGVLAVDPTVLGYFLQAVGSSQLPDGQVISAQNVVSLTEKDQYAIFPNNAERKKFVVAVLKASARKLTSGAGSAYNILRAASRSSSEQRLMVWARDPTIERLLVEGHYTGSIPRDSRPFSALVLNNAASGKLDYYLLRSLQYLRTGCGSDRDVTATITLKNLAPAAGLPAYVTTRVDHAPATAVPGDSRVILDYYATDGALLQGVTLNEQPSTAIVERASGHPIFRLDLELPRGTTQTIVLHLKEPAGTGSPVIWRQPGVTPMTVEAFSQNC